MPLLLEVTRDEEIEMEAVAPCKGTVKVARRRDSRVWLYFNFPKAMQIHRVNAKKGPEKKQS